MVKKYTYNYIQQTTYHHHHQCSFIEDYDDGHRPRPEAASSAAEAGQLLLSRKESSFPSLNFLFSGPFRKQHHYTASTAYGLCRDFQQHTRPHSGYWLLISTWNSIWIWNSWLLTRCLMMRFGLIHQAWPHIH